MTQPTNHLPKAVTPEEKSLVAAIHYYCVPRDYFKMCTSEQDPALPKKQQLQSVKECCMYLRWSDLN